MRVSVCHFQPTSRMRTGPSCMYSLVLRWPMLPSITSCLFGVDMCWMLDNSKADGQERQDGHGLMNTSCVEMYTDYVTWCTNVCRCNVIVFPWKVRIYWQSTAGASNFQLSQWYKLPVTWTYSITWTYLSVPNNPWKS